MSSRYKCSECGRVMLEDYNYGSAEYPICYKCFQRIRLNEDEGDSMRRLSDVAQ